MTGYAALAGLLHARSGQALGPDRAYLFEARLAPMVRREGVGSLEGLAARLSPGSALEAEFVEAMMTHESSFFRDGTPFDLLRRTILPRLHAARPAGTKLRIWSAGAAHGQEAYSIAMICAELAAAMPGRPIEIVATDIARAALAVASEGLYTPFQVQRGLTASLLAQHFDREGAGWRIRPALRSAVAFSACNLIAAARPVGRFDVVFCRNVLIYFDAPTKRRVLEGLAAKLQGDGRLILGGAETVLGLTDRLRSLPGEPGCLALSA